MNATRLLIHRLTPWAYGLTGLATAAMAALAFWQVDTATDAGGGPLPLLGEMRVSPIRGPGDIALQRAYARQRLALSPADAGAWVSLAYAARAQEGRCGRACNGALAEAFRVGPLDPLTFAWRTRFALENWPAVNPAVRDLTIRHMRYAWSTPEGRLAIKDMGASVREPSGRLAAKMVAGSLRAQPLARPDN